MRGLDGLAFVGPALLLVVGLFAESGGQLAITIMTIIGVVGLVSALYSARLSLPVIMDFADDMGLKRGLPWAALWMLRAASAFWFWMAPTFWALAQFHTDWSDMLIRAALIFLTIGAVVFAVGISWFIIYAWAKQQAHARPRE